MPTVLVIAPIEEPVSLAEARVHLRAEDTPDGTLIETLVQAAREQVEDFTRRQVMTATYDFLADSFPAAGRRWWWAEDSGRWAVDQVTGIVDTSEIELPRPRLQSVTSVKYVDVDGILQTLAATEYEVDVGREPGVVRLAYGKSWPSTRAQKNAVAIRYVCGYPSKALVPGRIKAAINLMVGHLYENREDSVVGTIISELKPESAKSLLWPLRIVRFA